ncbi:MAG: metal ABC transporter solute-binding protein, Zn/Mn family [Syntrophotalea sp.]|uniref:metal ABC transporter solute-binding protein, Zn/Mn family n=1 Tax=Syntrophotalea sp. TaxID=2812029 RepID=UPI003D0C3A04
MHRWILPLIGLLIVPSWSLAAEPPPLRVFVSVLPLKYLVDRVGGTHVDTDVMVGPGQSPATYEPTPRQMSRLGKTDLYFRVGVPFERVWIRRLADLNRNMSIIDLRDDLPLRRLEDHHHEDDGGAHREPHQESALDPHVWTSPTLASDMARHICEALSARDPRHAPDYQSGYETLAADLKNLDSRLRNRLAAIKNRKFLVFHPSWGYFADAYGLEQIAIENAGKEPGPRALARVIALARQENIRIIFVQQQFSRTTASTVARAIGGKVVVVDPLAENYIENLRRAADAFFLALDDRHE